jgi:hypothetical protein
MPTSMTPPDEAERHGRSEDRQKPLSHHNLLSYMVYYILHTSTVREGARPVRERSPRVPPQL